jgi:hypothetical protein
VAPGCYCQYGCTTDAECGQGAICLCGDPVGQCAAALCTRDDDCASDMLCSSYVATPGCGGTAFACQTPFDTCASDADCTMSAQCTLQAGNHTCVTPTCAIGRPFLVHGTPRVAELAARDDWRSSAEVGEPELRGLSAAQRETLATTWTRAGLMEHASIAAFARFSLQLLSMGAPPELAFAAQAAMADETKHARLCFGLASAYAGSGIGPGKLTVGDALDGRDARDILLAAIHEGCIGETMAAIEAAEAAAHAADPVIRRVLQIIAEDEMRHAELAFRFAAWAIHRDPALHEVASAALEAATSAYGRAGTVAGEDAAFHLLAFGVLDAERRRELQRRTLEQVITPCLSALGAKRAESIAEARAQA